MELMPFDNRIVIDLTRGNGMNPDMLIEAVNQVEPRVITMEEREAQAAEE
jgi:hypothetical protein